MKKEIIVEETCKKCGSVEKTWNGNKGRYDCLQCGKKWKITLTYDKGTVFKKVGRWWGDTILVMGVKSIFKIRKL